MKLVLSGDNEQKLSEREHAIIQEKRSENVRIEWVDCQRESYPSLQDRLGNMSLFATGPLWVVKRWESWRSPKQQAEFIALITSLADDVLLSINKELTPSQKKLFISPWKVESFALPKVVFQFVESLKVKPLRICQDLFLQALEQQGEWGLHALLVRQFHLLYMAKIGGPISGPPFVVEKIQTQARKFQLTEIQDALSALLFAEKSIKTGQTHLNWSAFIDILLTKLYDEPHL